MSVSRGVKTGGLPRTPLLQRRRLVLPGALIVTRTASQEHLSEGFQALNDKGEPESEQRPSCSSASARAGSVVTGPVARRRQPEATHRLETTCKFGGPDVPRRASTPRRPPDSPNKLDAPTRPAAPSGGRPRRRRVLFDSSSGRNFIPITPYALIYGRHPDHFNFDRLGKMRLTPNGVEAEKQGVQPWSPTVPTKGFACVRDG